MKAFDGHLERSIRDTGLDLKTSRCLSREFTTTLSAQYADKQRLSVATNYFALACPIMPLGLLGMFMLLGKLDDVYSRHHIDKAVLSDYERLAESGRQAYMLRAQRQAETKTRKIDFACSRPVEQVKPTATEKQRKRMDTSIKPGERQPQRFDRPNLLSKRQNDASKLIKQKMALEEHLERLSGQGDYHLYCRVSAQIDLLDKALKKLGS